MDRIYLDHNATTPLAPAVTRWLAKGDFFWANPSSQHSSGKKAAHELDQARGDLFRLFALNEKQFQLVYHSGATEAINACVRGWQENHPSPDLLFVYSPLDHACVRTQAARLQAMGIATCELVVNDQGELLLAQSLAKLAEYPRHKKLINFTWVHNETGVVWSLADAYELKKITGALVHVDAAQSIGKTSDWQKPLADLDYYSYSSHKCGGLKSHGFSFIKNDWPGNPLILGGGQQKGLRSGTENVMAAMALSLALSELVTQQNLPQQTQFITELRSVMDQHLQGVGERISAKAKLNLNTILFVLHKLPSDMSLPLFDLQGLELSAGAACSSGAAKSSHVLEALGLTRYAKNGLRISISVMQDAHTQQKILTQLELIFAKIKAAKI